MPNIQNRLHNPTPFDVKINWHAGIRIVVKADDFKDLDVNQMDDFRDGKPGSEEVQEMMNHYGLFLRDALNRSIRSKNAQYKAAVDSLRVQRAAQGVPEDAGAFDEIVETMGLKALKKDVVALEKRAKFLSGHVEAERGSTNRESFDPTKTLLFTDPPRTFPSAVALQMFVNDAGTEEIKALYEQQMKELVGDGE